mgnify:CR=1 FL=1
MRFNQTNCSTYITRLVIITCLLGYSFGALAQYCGGADDLSIDDISLKWSSVNESANSHGQPFVGDLDGDGSPEVIVTNEHNKTLNILDGIDNGTYDAIANSHAAIDLGFTPYNTVAIGDLDGAGSNYASIVVAGYTGSLKTPDHKMSIWRYNGTTMAQIGATIDLSDVTTSNAAPGAIGIADFNGTGPKIYFANVILNADLSLYAKGNDKNWPATIGHGSLALDVLGDDDLELITAGKIWKVNTDKSISLLQDINTDIDSDASIIGNYYVKTWKNFATDFDESRVMISAADYVIDANDHIELIFPGALGSKGTDATAVFLWSPNDKIVKVFKPSNHSRGAGRIAAGDTDGDGKMNALFVSGNTLYNLNDNFKEQWNFTVTEGNTTGYSGVTLYDFDGDGRSEILYRDRNYFKTFSDLGNIAQTILEAPCKSYTREEYPIVADLDNDGQAEICFSCLYDNSATISTANEAIGDSKKGVLRVYGASNGSRWQPTRGVWNQHAYMNVNVADDLSIPSKSEIQSLSIDADIDCYNGTLTATKPLNMFMSQAPLRGSNECPSFALPDFEIVIFKLSDGKKAVNPTSGNNYLLNTDIEVTFTIKNSGPVSISGELPITFYARNPLNDGYAGAKKLNTVYYEIENNKSQPFLAKDETTPVITQTVTGIGADFTWPYDNANVVGDDIFIIINEYGSTPPFELQDQEFPECGTDLIESNISKVTAEYNNDKTTKKEDNNVFSYDPPTGFVPTIVKVSDNIKCLSSKPDNGEARAYYNGTLGGNLQTIFIEDFEDNSITFKNTSNLKDPSGNWSATGGNTSSTTTDLWGVDFGRQASGRTFFVNNSVNAVILESKMIDITSYTDVEIYIDILTNNTLGSEDEVKIYYSLDDGSLYTLSSTSIGSFSYDQINIPIPDGSTFLKIKIEIKNNDTDEYTEIDNIIVTGRLPNNQAELTETDGFEFLWYSGDQTTDGIDITNPDLVELIHTGSSYTGMSDGVYTLVIRYINGGKNLYSAPLDVTIDPKTSNADVPFIATTNVTDCINPNGALKASINRSGVDKTADYTYNWYLNDEGVTSIETGKDLTKKPIGDYLVRAINNITGCEIKLVGTIGTSETLPPKPILDDASPVDPLVPRVISKHVTDCNDLKTGGLGINPDLAISGSALAFDGKDDYVVLPQVITGSFTIEYWMKTTQTGRNKSQWYGGRGIVDAEMPNVVADFGTSLVRDKLAFGVGRPDRTIFSTTSMNDGDWRHVAVTWEKDIGEMKLYINGKKESESTSASKQDRTAPKAIRIGGIQTNQPTNSNLFEGSLDELRIWGEARTASQIENNMNVLTGEQGALLSYYDFNDGIPGADNTSITMLEDKANSNDGIINNLDLTEDNTTSNFVDGPGIQKVYNYNWYEGTQDLGLLNVKTGPRIANLSPGKYTLVSVNVGSKCRSEPLIITLDGPMGYPVPTFNLVADDTGCEDGCIGGNGEFTAFGEADTTSTSAVENYAFEFFKGTTLLSNKLEEVLAFDGIDDYFECPDCLVSPLTDFTFEAWFKKDANNEWSRIFDFGTGTTTNMFLTATVETSGKPRFLITTGGNSSAQAQRLSSTNVIPLNTWTHYAVTIDSENTTGKLYINGSLVATNTAMTLTPSDLGVTTNNYFGKSQYPAHGYLNGSMDEVRMWSVARSQAEIRAAMNIQLLGSETDLVAYYDFNEGIPGGNNSSITTLENKANQYDGILNNFNLTDSNTTSNFTCMNNDVLGEVLGNRAFNLASGDYGVRITNRDELINCSSETIFNITDNWIKTIFTVDEINGYDGNSNGTPDRCELTTNLALPSSGATASMSSIYKGLASNNASKINDGATNGNGEGPCAITNDADDHPWIDLDLGAEKSISDIFVYNRTDGSQALVRNSKIMVSLIPFPSGVDVSSLTTAQSQSIFIYDVGNNQANIIPIEVNATGRYVRLQKSSGDGYINLAEIQIFEACSEGVENLTTPRTSCSSVNNGIINLTNSYSPTSGDFEFVLYKGTGANIANLAPSSINEEGRTSGIFTGLAPGTYTITVQSLSTLCFAKDVVNREEHLTVVIEEIENYPIISYATSPDTYCDGGDGTVAITSSSSIGEPTEGYTYQILDAITSIKLAPDVNVTDGSVGHVFTDLDAGSYFIVVTNNDLGCSHKEIFTIQKDYNYPIIDKVGIISTTDINHNTACAPNKNGKITIKSIDGINSNLKTNYSFEWYNGTTFSGDGLIASADKDSLTGLDEGKYSPKITNNTTGCATQVPDAITIINTSNLPSLTVTEVSPNTYCVGSAVGLNFDGTDDYVSLDDGLVSTLTDFTFEAWFEKDANKSWSRIFDFGNNTTQYMALTISEGNSGVPRFAISTGGSPQEQRLNSSDPIPTGTWTHYAVTIDNGSTTGKLYINGELVDTNTSMTLAPKALGPTTQNYLGKSIWGDPYLDGTMDEVRIWSVARSQSEIQAAMNIQLTGSETGLVANYRMNEGVANASNGAISSLLDASVNHKSAILHDFALTGTSSNFVAGQLVPGDGVATATVDAGVSVAWYTSDADRLANTNVLSTLVKPTFLSSTTYYVKASDAINGCSNTFDITISNDVKNPVISMEFDRDNTSCKGDDFNGFLTAKITLDNSEVDEDEYMFFWEAHDIPGSADFNEGTDDYKWLGDYKGHRYFLGTDKTYWPKARDRAEDLGGYLVILNDAAEKAWLKPKAIENAFLGYNDIRTDGDWEDVLGEPIGRGSGTVGWIPYDTSLKTYTKAGSDARYSDWYPNDDPNNSGDEDYAQFWTSDKNWNDIGFEKQEYIVEIELPSGTSKTLDKLSGGIYSVYAIGPNGCKSNTIDPEIDNDYPDINPGMSIVKDNTICSTTKNEALYPNGTAVPDANGSMTFVPTTNGVNDNIARIFGASISQSSYKDDNAARYAASFATDGDKMNRTRTDNFAQTKDENDGSHQWINLDLGSIKNVSEILWYNQTGLEAIEMQGTMVMASKTAFPSGTTPADYTNAVTNASWMIDVDLSFPDLNHIRPEPENGGINVRYIRFQKTLSTTLPEERRTLIASEIEIYGDDPKYSFEVQLSSGNPKMIIDHEGKTDGFTSVSYNTRGAACTVTGLPKGTYLINITDEGSFCADATIFDVKDQPYPGIAIDKSAMLLTRVKNRSCKPGSYTGEIDAYDAISNARWVKPYYTTQANPFKKIAQGYLLTGVIDGSYMFFAEDLETGCKVQHKFIIEPDLPVIAATESGQSDNNVCDPIKNDPTLPDYNGATTVTPTLNGAGQSFKYELFYYVGLIQTPIPNTGLGTGKYKNISYNLTGPTTTISGLAQGHTIWLRMIDPATLCSEDINIIVGENFTEKPLINISTVTITPNTYCDPLKYDGQANASTAVSAGSGNYRYEWYPHNDMSTPIDNDANLDKGTTGVEDGRYVLSVIDNVTGCRSLGTDIIVSDGKILPPIITTVVSIDYICSPSSPTAGSGSITASVTGGSTGYTFDWYFGNSPTGAVLQSTTDLDNTLTNRTDGNYTVKVVNSTTLCFDTDLIKIIEDVPAIIPSITKDSDQNRCNPADGQATVTPNATFFGKDKTGFVANYTYQWFDGESSVSPIALADNNSAQSATLTGVVAGWYTVVVTETSSGCISNPEKIKIFDVTPPAPLVTITALANPGSCDGAGGIIQANVLGGIGPLTYYWYEGSNDYSTEVSTGFANHLDGTNVIISSGLNDYTVTSNTITPSILNDIPSNYYTLVVQDGSGCTHQTSYFLPYNGIQITTTILASNALECPDNGSATVSLRDNLIFTVDTRSGGNFNVLESVTGATSGKVGTISYDGARSFNDTELQGAMNVASESFTIGEVITGNTTGAQASITGISGLGIENGKPDDIREYILYLYAAGGVPADKTARITKVNSEGDSLQFPYTFNPNTGDVLDFDNIIVSSPGIISTAGGVVVFGDLPAGPYTTLARERNPTTYGSSSQCWSTPATDIIEQIAFEPIISSVAIVDDTYCDPSSGNGSITINGDKYSKDKDGLPNPGDGDQPNNFNFELFEDNAGSPKLPGLNTVTNNTSATFSNLNAGTYWVTATRMGLAGPASNGCDITMSYTVMEDPEPHNIAAVTMVHNDDCNPLNGSATLSDLNLTDNTADYTFTWYESDKISLLGTTTTSATFPTANVTTDAKTVNNLLPGTYYVKGIHDTKLCETPLFEFTIDDNRVYPLANTTVLAPDIICDDILFTSTGEASADVILGGFSQASTNYNFTWYDSDGTTLLADAFIFNLGAATVSNGTAGASVIKNMPSGTYYVVAEDNTNSIGCINTPKKEVIIPQFDPTITIGTLLSTDYTQEENADCSPLDGRIEVLRVTESRPTPTADLINTDMSLYTFEWFESDATTLLGNAFVFNSLSTSVNNGTAGASVVNDLPAGNYFVKVTNSGQTGCAQTAAEMRPFTILDETHNPQTTTIATATDIVCDETAFAPTGIATANVLRSGIVQTSGDFKFTWFMDSAMTNLLDAADVATVTFDGKTNGDPGANVIKGLSEGTYWVFTEDTSGDNLGCTSFFSKSVVIYQHQTIFSIASSTKQNSNDCDPVNGSYEITSIQENRPIEAGSSATSNDTISTDMSDYVFQWFESNDSLPLGTITTTVTFPKGANGTAGASKIANLPVGNYYVQIKNNYNSGCEQPISERVKISLLDVTVDPIIVQDTTIASVDCARPDFDGDGSLVISLASAETDYTIEWFRGDTVGTVGDLNWLFGTSVKGNGASVGTAAKAASTSHLALNGLSDGNYTVSVVDTTNPSIGCENSSTLTIQANTVIPTIVSKDSLSVVHNTLCSTSGNGSILLTSADISLTPASGNSNVDDFNWSLRFNGGAATIPAITGIGVASQISLTNLLHGNYELIATSKIGICSSAIRMVLIKDEGIGPTINSANQIPDAGCGGDVRLGTIELTVIDGAVPAANYNYQWYVGQDTLGSTVDATYGVNGSSFLLDSVPQQYYTVKIINTISGCVSTQIYNILNDPYNPSIYNFFVSPSNICPQTGSGYAQGNGFFNLISVLGDLRNDTTITTDSMTLANEYTLEHTGITDYDTLTPFQIDSLVPGTYSVAVLRKSSQCISDYITFTVPDEKITPFISFKQIQADSSCSTSAPVPNGILVATADGSSGPGYSFQWSDLSGNPLDTNDTLSSLSAGTYQLVVSDSVTKCVAIDSMTLTNEPFEFGINGYSFTDPTFCDSTDGIIGVTSVDRISSLAGSSALTYQFYEGESGYVGSLVQDDTLNVFLEGKANTTYFFQATNPDYNCSSDLIQVFLSDSSFVYPIITLVPDQFWSQFSCDPTAPTGRLSIAVDTINNNPDFTYEWVKIQISGALIISTVLPITTAVADSLAAGTYRVTATNNITGCQASEEYILNNEIQNPIAVSTSTSSNINCVNPNGQMGASVLYIGDNRAYKSALDAYTYYWFEGLVTETSPDVSLAKYIGLTVDSVAAGIYTVYAVDNITDCFTSDPTAASSVVEVEDESTLPDLEINVVNDLTICDPKMADGFAKIIDSENEIFKYTIAWYTGIDTTQSVPFQYGTFADSLLAGNYLTMITNNITRCVQFEVSDVLDLTETVASPNIVLFSDRTHCTYANGHAAVSVLGETDFYEFTWYLEADPRTVVFTGAEIDQLDTATYRVLAQNLTTTCYSEPSQITIDNGISDPAFRVEVTASLCNRTEDGSTNQFTGGASIVFEEYHTIDSISWIDEKGVEINYGDPKAFVLGNAAPGKYTVYFKPENGCLYEASFTIETSITVYNGLSVNDDGNNDFFLIDCADFFVNNNVKIFNMEGELIYEVNSYDNLNNRFEGYGNIGNSTDKLPVGTYFYMIDKGDGSKIFDGFLELVR